ELPRAAFRACLRRRPRTRLVAGRARPDRDLVTPPELSRDAPVGSVHERVDREAVLALRVVANALRAQRVDRRPTELVHAAPPLRRDERLDARVAALARADGMAVALALLELIVLAQPRDDALVHLVLRQAFEALRRYAPVGADHRQRGQPVVAADLEVGRVVPGRDLERARAELDVDALVCDHRYVPFDDR